MRNRLLVPLLVVTALTAWPARASAEILLTPFAGVGFVDDEAKLNFGASVGFGGLIGFEFDASRTSIGELRDIPVVDLTANVTTLMGNLVVRLPTGPVQPYGSAGVGVIRLSGDLGVPFLGTIVSASGQDLGMNAGGGVYFFPSQNFGIRGDVRYFRTLGDFTLDDITNIGGIEDLPLPRLDFWRATVGVTFKF